MNKLKFESWCVLATACIMKDSSYLEVVVDTCASEQFALFGCYDGRRSAYLMELDPDEVALIRQLRGASDEANRHTSKCLLGRPRGSTDKISAADKLSTQDKMSEREAWRWEFAGRAMQGMLSRNGITLSSPVDVSVEYADALIKALEGK